MKLAILCGGQATRLGLMTTKKPKSLIPVAGKPFIYHQLDMIDSYVDEVVLCTGYLGNQIYQEVGIEYDGIFIRYSKDGAYPLGTAGALRNALPLLGDDPFFVLYGDMYLPEINFEFVASVFEDRKTAMPILMTVIANDNPRHTNNVRLLPNGRIEYNKGQAMPGATYIDYGLSVMQAEALLDNQYLDLALVFRDWSIRQRLNHLEMVEPFYSIGSPDGLAEFRDYMEEKN